MNVDEVDSFAPNPLGIVHFLHNRKLHPSPLKLISSL